MANAEESDLQKLLQSRFGLSAFRDGQLEVIQRLISGRSAAAIFPTGGGKSLCYQLPALLSDRLTLVVSPLLALMREQVDQLRERGIQAERLDSTLSPAELREINGRVRDGSTKLLYVAPERFFNERFRGFIEGISIGLFAIDEAHCISQWGHSFRPDYLKLARIAKQLEAQSVLALTATATPRVLEDIQSAFEIAAEDCICTSFHRANLQLTFQSTTLEARNTRLADLIERAGQQTTLIYVTLQRTAEEVAEFLQKKGHDARAYHAGMDSEDRQQVQDWFLKSDTAIVVATIAFGMGIDKPNIRSVIHYNISKSIENYAQEIGRAGRDGDPSECTSLIVAEDRVTLDNFAHGDAPSREAVERFVGLIVGQPREFFISYYSAAYETDIREPVVRTLMTYLELNDYLIATSPRYDVYKFKPKITSTEILSHFEGEKRQFAASVLALTVKKKIWFDIALPQAAKRLDCPRERIVRMLDFFADKGWIELQVSGLVFGYRKAAPITDIDALTDQLHAYLDEREKGEVNRLDELIELLVADECQSALLSEHFGQKLDQPCGKCSACTGESLGGVFPEADYGQVGDSAIRAASTLVNTEKFAELLASPRDVARFLCGMNSPRMIRKRLTREAAYGCCSNLPFRDVLAVVEEAWPLSH